MNLQHKQLLQEEASSSQVVLDYSDQSELKNLDRMDNSAGPSVPSSGQENVPLQHPSISPIVLQPGSLSANLQFTDAMSQQIYNAIPGRHVTATDIHRTINDASQHLIQSFGNQHAAAKEGMSYDRMVQSLMLKGERVQMFSGGTWALQYSSTTFCDEQSRPFQTKPPGIVMLTDKRFIFVSSQFNSSMSLSEFGDPKKLPGGYSVKCAYQDSTFYLPIPINNIYSVELRGSSGMSGEISITAEPPCCGGMCLMFRNCCPSSTKQWAMGPTISNQFKELVLQIGVTLPPWGLRCFLVINLAPDVPVPVARDFISLLQQVAPKLM